MKLKPYFLPVLTTLVLLLLAGGLACSAQPEEDAGEIAPSNQPAANLMGRTAAAPMDIDRQLVAEFVVQQQEINAAWDQFHTELDGWRAGLTACDRSAANAALRGFAADFTAITQEARDLPGKTIARDLPSKVIDAAIAEEAALRRLRDNWQPGDPTLLEEVQVARDEATVVLRQTAAALDELEALDRPAEQDVAIEFSEAFAPVDQAWDVFHDNYDDLLEQREELGIPKTLEQLEGLVSDLEDILGDLDSLPSDEATDSILADLTDAAEGELGELESLLETYQDKAEAAEKAAEDEGAKAEEAEEAEEQAEEEMADSKEDSDNQEEAPTAVGEKMDPETVKEALALPDNTDQATDSGEPEEEEDDSELFEAMTQLVDDSNQVRRKSRRALEKLAEGLSPEDKASLVAFTATFGRLTGNWDSFHDDYDGWVLTEGDCDQAAAAAALGQFGQQFGQLASQVRGLSQASYLRPATDLLAEAAGREEAALRTLRNTWAPYRNDVYRGLDQERANGDNLRRQAGRRTQELLERNGISQ